MTTYFTETFTQSNGTAWSGSLWTATVSSTGASATVQSNQGQMIAGTSTSGQRVQEYTGTQRTDCMVTAKVTLSSSSTSGRLENWVRGDDSTNPGNGYFVIVKVGSAVTLRKGDGFSYTVIGTSATSPAQGTQYNYKLYAVGSAIKFKIWTGTEPGWELEVTDTTHTGAGDLWFACANGGTTNYTLLLDDITYSDGGESAITLSGSITPTGALVKRTSKSFAGSITPAGALSVLKVISRLFSGNITPTGALVKQASKSFAGSITPTGALVKQTSKSFAGSITPVGTFVKSFIRTLTGSMGMSGTLTITNLGRVFGRPGRAIIRAVKAGEAFLRSRRN